MCDTTTYALSLDDIASYGTITVSSGPTLTYEITNGDASGSIVVESWDEASNLVSDQVTNSVRTLTITNAEPEPEPDHGQGSSVVGGDDAFGNPAAAVASCAMGLFALPLVNAQCTETSHVNIVLPDGWSKTEDSESSVSFSRLCEVNHYVSGNVCTPCVGGFEHDAGADPVGEDTACSTWICEANERVLNFQCVACDPGTTNEAGDDASQGDSKCVATICDANEKVVNHACEACELYHESEGADASGDDTNCSPILCGVNEYVSNHVCTPCAYGYGHASGADSSQEDTECYEIKEVEFEYVGFSTQSWVVPEGVTQVSMEAYGAEGGTSQGQNGGSHVGGRGAYRKATGVPVTPGSTLTIIVGGAGSYVNACGAGGGGGSWVYTDSTLHMVAGGGGGGFHCNWSGDSLSGGHGLTGTSGGPGNCDDQRPSSPGGTNGNGGTSQSYGGGGAGWFSDGTGSNPGTKTGNPNQGGGFGGGGGSYSGCCGNAGGGGGYSGGSLGTSDICAGGGGGSYSTGTLDTATEGARYGNGYVKISY